MRGDQEPAKAAAVSFARIPQLHQTDRDEAGGPAPQIVCRMGDTEVVQRERSPAAMMRTPISSWDSAGARRRSCPGASMSTMRLWLPTERWPGARLERPPDQQHAPEPMRSSGQDVPNVNPKML